MRLEHLRIHNFRGIIDASMDFLPYALLVGANNGGKSTVIDCLRAFYEKDGFRFREERDFPLKGAADHESWVELTFALTDAEHATLKTSYQTAEKKLRVKKFFKTEHQLHDRKKASGCILAYQTDGSLSDEPFYGAKNVQNGKFGELIYIPAVSRIEEHTRLTGPSALRDLLASIMANGLTSGTAHESLTRYMDEFASTLRSPTAGPSLDTFEKDLNELLGPWGTKFALDFRPPAPADILKSMLDFTFRDADLEQPQELERFGSGFQRHFIYSLMQLASKYLPAATSSKTKDFCPDLTLVLFEEPEAYLHPPMQAALARSLKSLSGKPGWQVICTTHSTHFVSKNIRLLSAIIRVRRSEGIVRVFQIGPSQWDTIVGHNQDIFAAASADTHLASRIKPSDQDLAADTEAIKYCLWLDPDRAGMFFAQHVLLVEGPTETALLMQLVDDGHLHLPEGCHVVDSMGKYNTHRYMALLTQLGIRHTVLIDDDQSQNGHGALNEFIYSKRCQELTWAIIQISGDLEKYLLIEKCKDPRKKPQHMLYLYNSGDIDAKRLEEFCICLSAPLHNRPAPDCRITLH